MLKPGKVLSTSFDSPRLRLDCDRGVIEITVYRENVVHFAYYPTAQHPPLAMHGIIAKPQATGIETEARDTHFIVRTERLLLDIDLATAQFELHPVEVICNFPFPPRCLLKSLSYGLEPAMVSGESCYHLHASFAAPEDEHYYGLGQHQLGWMDHRGKEVRIWHDYQAEGGEIIGVPFLVTNKNYAVVLDNASRVTLTPGSDGCTTWRAEAAQAISFFIIGGTTADDLYGGYRFLTGETPLLPKSAYGYIQCKQRYASQEEVLGVAREYRRRHLPCDVLVVDWFHWKTLGDLDVDPAFWPDVAAMNRELAGMNFDVMISCWPRFMKESKHYGELEGKRWFMKTAEGETLYGTPEDQRGAVIDTTNRETGRWFWEKVRDSYAARGFSSWWLDENEPDVCPHPYFLDAGTGAAVHNLYPLAHTQAVYEGHRRDLKSRCLILSRSAYLGAQRNGATFWSSDIYPRWDVLARQIPAGLNFCASGFAYWSSDIGGWQDLPEKATVPERPPLIAMDESLPEIFRKHPDYLELYVRWFEYGAFCPTFRAHGSRPVNEVWSYGAAAEGILTKYLKLRYRLLPYIYSLGHAARVTGAPFMRALFMDFPGDASVADIKDEYMFGPAFLVAPVVEQGVISRRVYLPKGAEWYDFWTGEKHAGGQTISVSAPIETLPLFVRAGSIVPMGDEIEHVGEAQDEIELHVYAGRDCTFELYDDDGKTYHYERGEFHVTQIRWNDASQKMAIDADPRHRFTLRVHQ